MGRVPTLTGLPSTTSLLRPSTSTAAAARPTLQHSQVRHATFIPRPRRPYTFTQLVTLSDGSTYTVRTTSPQPIYRAAKDTRNTLTWQPSERSLKNVELDEAGRLAAFRERFGRAFDTQAAAAGEEEGGEAAKKETEEFDDGGYGDLISSYATDDSAAMKDAPMSPTKKKR